MGFSLVELSIVLVILGLLTGGILAGQSLIRAAELRSVTTQYQRYTTALMSFRDKYMALPGDMKNATSFWGTDSAGCPFGGGTGTCNGDGDGIISPFPMSSNSEYYRDWQQLQLAGLIEGSYSGIPGASPGPNGNSDVIGINIPKSKFNNAGWVIYYVGSANASSYSLPAGHRLILANGIHPTYKFLTGPVMKAADMWNIDTKMDDGRPDRGAIQTDPGYAGGCATSASAPATYDLIATGDNCNFTAHLGF